MRVEHRRNGSTVIVGSVSAPVPVPQDEVRAATGRPDSMAVDVFMSSDQADLRPIVVVINSTLVNTRYFLGTSIAHLLSLWTCYDH
jgi:hypothetical protein